MNIIKHTIYAEVLVCFKLENIYTINSTLKRRFHLSSVNLQ